MPEMQRVMTRAKDAGAGGQAVPGRRQTAAFAPLRRRGLGDDDMKWKSRPRRHWRGGGWKPGRRLLHLRGFPAH